MCCMDVHGTDVADVSLTENTEKQIHPIIGTSGSNFPVHWRSTLWDLPWAQEEMIINFSAQI